MMSVYSQGLWIAAALSVTNVVTDVCRKKALVPNDLYSTSFHLRLVTTTVFVVFFAAQVTHGGWPGLHPAIAAGAATIAPGLPAWCRFVFFLVLDVAMVAVAQALYLRALQFADLSYFLPFVALTPVLLIPTGYLLVGEMPLPHQLAGVLLIVAGSLAMNERAMGAGWRSILLAPFERRASRYALLIALLFALSNPVDKIVVAMADPLPYAVCYSVALLLFFWAMSRRERPSPLWPVKGSRRWVVLGGCLDALTLLLQFTAYRYLSVVLVIGVKRAGVILSVLAGWLVFREKNIAGRLFATGIMAAGILLIYIPATRAQEFAIFAVAVAAVAVRVLRQRRAA